MKIVRNNKVYVQNKDLTKTMIGSIVYKAGIPNEVVSKVFTDSFVVTEDNLDDYVCFNEEDSINFFNQLPFIVDYDVVNSLENEVIIKKMQEELKSVNEISKKYNSSLEKQTKNAFEESLLEIDLHEHTFFDLRNILWDRRGHIKLKMPFELTDAYVIQRAFRNNKK